jgi:probable phosphoglycerate mutase
MSHARRHVDRVRALSEADPSRTAPPRRRVTTKICPHALPRSFKQANRTRPHRFSSWIQPPIFVRHGESLQNRGDITVEADSGLTELGWRQSLLVADWLARTQEVQVVLSSSMRRARQTAELIGRRLGLPLVVVPGLEEANRSYWDELPAAHQAGPLSLWDEVWLPSAENAPSYSEFRSRLRYALEEILSAHAGKTVVIVSHGGSIGTILRSLFRRPRHAGIHAEHWRHNACLERWTLATGRPEPPGASIFNCSRPRLHLALRRAANAFPGRVEIQHKPPRASGAGSRASRKVRLELPMALSAGWSNLLPQDPWMPCSM